MENNDKYLVYENWRAEKKAVVHKAGCGHANEGHQRIQNQWLRNNPSPNDRWFGYFDTLNAIAFAVLLPDRQFKMCEHCLAAEKAMM
ncbi:MAG TPA: hypothetical protein VIU45_02585 [Chitinophagaceae bacterium]